LVESVARREGLTIRAARVELDLGATAKALVCDRAATAAAAVAGGALVGLGGDIAVAGAAPAGGWPVRIADDHAAPLGRSRPDGGTRGRRPRDVVDDGAPLA